MTPTHYLMCEIFDQSGQSKYFSCIDMVKGYHQIEMTEDRAKTAFSTKEGQWEYKLLPFGLKTAPATFQRMMNVVLSGLTLFCIPRRYCGIREITGTA